MNFGFARTPKILFGAGNLKLLPEIIEGYGNNILILTGRSSFYNSTQWIHLTKKLSSRNILWNHYIIPGEPSPALIDDCVLHSGFLQPDIIIAIGGGSVMDAGKAISAMWPLQEPVKPYLEGVGDDRVHDGRKIPFVAVPTTSGTGSEATKNAVISEVGEHGFKKSLRHDQFVPDLAIIDPELTLNCPQRITAWSGMDAFTQLLESYLSTNANPMSDSIALSGLEQVANYLERVVDDGSDIEARSGMAYAAFCSGITLANAGLGVVHGFASSIGGRFNIPHGLVCASLMGVSNEITLNKLLKEIPDDTAIRKYTKVGQLLYGSTEKDDIFYAEFVINKIHDLALKFDLPRLSEFGFDEILMDEIVSETSNKNNPVKLSQMELIEILEKVI